jgi:hypothetical protein
MRWLERIELRLHWLAFPGLFKWLTLLGVGMFAYQWVDPNIHQTLGFDRQAILGGEWWRLATFVFDAGLGFGFTAWGAFLLYFAVRIAFLVSDSLEQVWGTTRMTLYLLVGWIGLAAAHWVLDLPSGNAGEFLYLAAFFAFATYFPRVEFLLFFILPVQVRIFAWLAFGRLIFLCSAAPPLFLLLGATCLPYVLWVLPAYIRNRKTLLESGIRRRKFQKKLLPDEAAFHRCEECGRTDKSDPDLDFRTMLDGTEYCVDHLPDDSES